ASGLARAPAPRDAVPGLGRAAVPRRAERIRGARTRLGWPGGDGLNELAVRAVTGMILIAGALLAAVQGGNVLAVIVAAIATVMFYEWTRIVRGWGAAWYISGFFYALLPALVLLWIRERDVHGLALLIW